MALSFLDAKRISIVEYLFGLGFEPVKIRGSDYWYNSPFRHERSPSFKVNAKLNLWYDHGSGEGGTFLDLGAKLYQCSLHEFLDRISIDSGSINSSFHQHVQEVPNNKLDIISISNLSDVNLIQYLNSRKIPSDIGKLHCKEVEFKIGTKSYVAIGFRNRAGGFELRNSWFKGSSSPKDISLIENQAGSLSVLEGFMDYLSVLTIKNNTNDHQHTAPSNYLILNSLSFLNRNIEVLKSYDEVTLFLDNDLAGKEAKHNIISKGIQFQDASTFYAPYKDVNEFLMKSRDLAITLPRSRGNRL